MARYNFYIIPKNDTTQNLYDVNHFVEDVSVDWQTGELIPDAESFITAATDFLDIKEGMAYKIKYLRGCAFYDADKAYVGGVPPVLKDGRAAEGFATAPKGARYIRLSNLWGEQSEEYSEFNDNEMYEGIKARPLYKDDASLDISMHNSERFFRRKLTGTYTFVRNDYDYIMRNPFDTKFTMYTLAKEGDEPFAPVCRSTFARTDCKVNEDDKTIAASLHVDDEYTDVLNNYGKEYDLLKLAPQIEQISLTQRPLLQVYMPDKVAGNTMISCFVGSTQWEEECENVPNVHTLLGTYHFALGAICKKVVVSSVYDEYKGVYYGILAKDNINDNKYHGTLYKTEQGGATIEMTIYIIGGEARDKAYVDFYSADGQMTYRYVKDTIGDFEDTTFTAVNITSSVNTIDCEMTTRNVLSRYLLNTDKLIGRDTLERPVPDITDGNDNYKRVIGYENKNIAISYRTSVNPTQWGRKNRKEYFAPPLRSIGTPKYYPIAQSNWVDESFWCRITQFEWGIEKQGRKQYTLRHSYPLASCIKVLLKEIAPAITHEGTPEYSQFLYGNNNPLSGDAYSLMITPKSNILNGDYETPAQKAIITLKEILEMLRKVYQCYWYIEEGRLKIENIDFFRNGGSYIITRPAISYDLTQMLNTRNGKNWSYSCADYTYDKSEIPSRYEFEWSDDTTELFKGSPIDIISAFAQEDKKEEISVAKFTSDIDKMIITPSDFNQEGFALLSVVNKNALVNWVSGRPMTGNNGICQPVASIAAEYRGKDAKIRCVNTGAIPAQIAYLNESGVSELGAIVQPSTREQTISTHIPSDATHVSFVVDGSATINLYDLRVEGFFEVPFTQMTLDYTDYELQNGYLAFCDLQPKYYRTNMPSSKVIINGEQTTALISRQKKQVVKFPCDINIDPIDNVKTFLGNGEIEKITINLSSSAATATLRYNTNSTKNDTPK